MKFGLLGEHLGHSYSPRIHGLLHGEAYGLCEVPPENVEAFLAGTELDGLNVTIPYKRRVMGCCASLSETARKVGCVNTLVRGPEGWRGYNTDYDGFRHLLMAGGLNPAGWKTLVLGSGGASLTARTVLKDLGAAEICVMTRHLPEHPSAEAGISYDTYDRAERHADAELIVNATPVGMYPNNGASPVDLGLFPACRGVADVIYNPARTALLMQAEERGIPWAGGLGMLVAQARRSAELWLGREIADRRVEEICGQLARETENIVLIGMPGSGKTSIGERLRAETGRVLIDTDEEVARMAGKPVPALILEEGEAAFRRLETLAIAEAGKQSGRIIATGGGCVTREENYPHLHQNGRIFWIRRDPALLPTEGRPLSQAESVRTLYERRKGQYARFADRTVENDSTVAEAAARILEQW